MAYLSTGSSAQGVQLKVQELIVAITDTAVVSVSSTTLTIDCGQTVASVREALFVDNSAATVAPVTAANTSISGSIVTLTLSAQFAANDSVRLCFVV